MSANRSKAESSSRHWSRSPRRSPWASRRRPAPPPRTPFTVTDYCGGQCSDILPPGENGNATLADILGNKVFGTAPEHTDDQLNTYGNLADSYQNLTNATIDQLLQRLVVRRAARPGGQQHPAAQRRDDRARQGNRRAAHLRHHPIGHRVRRRLRGRRRTGCG